MTPAVEVIRAAEVPHTIHAYEHSSDAASYGMEAVEKLGVPESRVFKTLVAKLDGKDLVVAVLPVSATLRMKSLARVAGGKRAEMAQPDEVERVTGYVLGGVSPLGQRKLLPTFLDERATHYETIYVSAGKRGLEIELAASTLQGLTGASIAAITA
ncbi:MAG: Cys-tRNA(Pro) deacylase [Pseudomonadales bacterium]